MALVSRASAKQFLNPGISLNVDGIRYFAEMCVD